jgi:hypothetical protein
MMAEKDTSNRAVFGWNWCRACSTGDRYSTIVVQERAFRDVSAKMPTVPCLSAHRPSMRTDQAWYIETPASA